MFNLTTSPQSGIQWRYWLVLLTSFGYFGFSDWLLTRIFGYGLWPLYLVSTGLLFTLQWWLFVPHPDGLRWIVGSIGVFTLSLLITTFWLEPLFRFAIQTYMPNAPMELKFRLQAGLTYGFRGLLLGFVQATALPACYKPIRWIMLSTLVYGLAGLRLLYFL
ncbi:hypothetical protein [Herpetosiphon giganteus]|uniref:hypothetical protein n=1 Tax=Herpetosiphon giganteus TaxID=2029754 RepID=UPI00195E4DB9|nr:hypothetical protein [Herpetosiphon giganteus]MBM7845140.1 hypothetical protein [Herpetosiphon giganteus]